MFRRLHPILLLTLLLAPALAVGSPPTGAAPATWPPQPATALPGTPMCFVQTGYCLRGSFLLYWRVNGAVQTSDSRGGTTASTGNFVAFGSEAADNGLTWYGGAYFAWGSATSTSDWLGEPSALVAPSILRTGGSALCF